MKTPLLIFYWILKLAVAGILFQTLYFKFTGAPESVYIFTQMGMEPWGRYATGIGELIAGILILIPRTDALGALMSLGVISGALISHLTILGIEVQDDGGLLFILALTVFLASLLILAIRRQELKALAGRFLPA